MEDARKKSFVPSVEGMAKIGKFVNLMDLIVLETESFRTIDSIRDECTLEDKIGVRVIETKPVSNTFQAAWHLGLRALSKDDEELDQVLFQIEARYLVTYELPDRKKITKKDVQSFIVLNGIVHVWPFWREFVRDHTARMGVPIVILGVRHPRNYDIELIDN